MTTLLRLALVVGFAACASGPTAPPVAPATGAATAPATKPTATPAANSAASTLASQIEAVFEKMETTRLAALCRCTDAACVETVTRDYTAWSEEFAKTGPADIKLEDATTRKMTALTMETTACAHKASSGSPAE